LRGVAEQELTKAGDPRRSPAHATFVFQALLENHYPRGADGALGYDELARSPPTSPAGNRMGQRSPRLPAQEETTP